MSDVLRPILPRPQELVSKPALPQGPVPKPPGKGKTDIHDAAVAFEGMLISTMFQNMRKTIQPSGLLGDSGQARGTLEYLLDQAIVDSAMKGGKSWGLAQRLEEAWLSRGPQAESKHPNPVQEFPSRGR